MTKLAEAKLNKEKRKKLEKMTQNNQTGTSITTKFEFINYEN